MRPHAALAMLLCLLPACSGSDAGDADTKLAPARATEKKVTAPSPGEDVEKLTNTARARVKTFAGALKGELMAAMKAGGPTSAIDVCNERAPRIAQEDSTEGWTVARRSLRLRNPDNAPDAWERAQLESFAARMKAGESVHELEHAEVLEVQGQRIFRYAKAIPLGGECLACHGNELAPEVTAALDARYPDDAARGYVAGELRGIFSVSKSL